MPVWKFVDIWRVISASTVKVGSSGA